MSLSRRNVLATLAAAGIPSLGFGKPSVPMAEDMCETFENIVANWALNSRDEGDHPSVYLETMVLPYWQQILENSRFCFGPEKQMSAVMLAGQPFHVTQVTTARYVVDVFEGRDSAVAETPIKLDAAAMVKGALPLKQYVGATAKLLPHQRIAAALYTGMTAIIREAENYVVRREQDNRPLPAVLCLSEPRFVLERMAYMREAFVYTHLWGKIEPTAEGA